MITLNKKAVVQYSTRFGPGKNRSNILTYIPEKKRELNSGQVKISQNGYSYVPSEKYKRALAKFTKPFKRRFELEKIFIN